MEPFIAIMTLRLFSVIVVALVEKASLVLPLTLPTNKKRELLINPSLNFSPREFLNVDVLISWGFAGEQLSENFCILLRSHGGK